MSAMKLEFYYKENVLAILLLYKPLLYFLAFLYFKMETI